MCSSPEGWIPEKTRAMGSQPTTVERRRKVRELKDLVHVATEAAERAARLLRSTTPANSRDWIEKGRHDFVTQADRQAEALIADILLRAVPESRVVGEELSPAAVRSGEVVWIVDPLDGTTNFLHGYPQYAVSIGALVGGALSVGVVHDVPRDRARSEEHTSELQSLAYLVCRLLLEKKKKT